MKLLGRARVFPQSKIRSPRPPPSVSPSSVLGAGALKDLAQLERQGSPDGRSTRADCHDQDALILDGVLDVLAAQTAGDADVEGMDVWKQQPSAGVTLTHAAKERFYGSLTGNEVEEELRRMGRMMKALVKEVEITKEFLWQLEGKYSEFGDRLERVEQKEMAASQAATQAAVEATRRTGNLSERTRQLLSQADEFLERLLRVENQSRALAELRIADRNVLDSRFLKYEEKVATQFAESGDYLSMFAGHLELLERQYQSMEAATSEAALREVKGCLELSEARLNGTIVTAKGMLEAQLQESLQQLRSAETLARKGYQGYQQGLRPPGSGRSGGTVTSPKAAEASPKAVQLEVPVGSREASPEQFVASRSQSQEMAQQLASAEMSEVATALQGVEAQVATDATAGEGA